jgi:hypothetical protein
MVRCSGTLALLPPAVQHFRKIHLPQREEGQVLFNPRNELDAKPIGSITLANVKPNSQRLNPHLTDYHSANGEATSPKTNAL